MSHITLEKLNTNVSHLQKEIEFLRSLIIGLIGKEKEGEYKPEFVEKVLKASREKATYSFKDKKAFLSQLENL
ncbi:MAG: hypothetical protein A3I88_01150 [Candidatus Portnoybacteria bacterium RIFCSPLOWO2_12_FULL_39_9]|uniref:Uncharacterized protein n=1 Tax=Candidatus Portnoybacteria bacterium RIFCSPHIGHO2_12_FULL_38_9 TaxID=1801997 RepID=A0A1G2FHG8_9BACT|nr:MAG: hypothetical protein A3H00_01545 [Candidatus Portnoybacteria bacterium RBG_13_40_8]OGZ36592.1 MAG: hypothetical protein A2646_00210 [Candidatus Portnoybacteria bacterium RIFCSPHIGHO2_02_FULL_39_12]OGZ37486.1 MAG: hypothetical protein A3J64_00635 [Candidatus Portnoybacteria bacterium RIFCSPHIGHO2_12_FULL_38_9]OGZ39132.1 MAG: hypothetical protein A3F21_00210 [Candidatus Portnoybacteria bacterium RIFCSPLOWO2_01_FULL_38_39]OGZ39826.1 MAG: hypothetical protein A3I88_01150 [Candidatus Portnoy